MGVQNMWKSICISVGLVALSCLPLWAQLARSEVPDACSALQNHEPIQFYHIQLSDVLEVVLTYAPELNDAVTVQPDGFIRLKQIGSVQVLGKTLSEAQAAIMAAYGTLLKRPETSIVLKDFQKPSFYADGEISKPGRYEIRGCYLTILQALSEAGGLVNERAKKTQVVIFRPEQDGKVYETTLLNVKDLLKGKDTEMNNAVIRPGDIIYVPQNRLSKIERFIPTPTIGTYISPTIL
jgi:polysaccharide export outer membrane protein